MKPVLQAPGVSTLKAPGVSTRNYHMIKLLSRLCDRLPSSLAFNFNLRPYIEGAGPAGLDLQTTLLSRGADPNGRGNRPNHGKEVPALCLVIGALEVGTHTYNNNMHTAFYPYPRFLS